MCVCVCDRARGTQCVRQQIAVGGAAGTTLIVCFSEKWNVVITAVIKAEQEMFLCGAVLIPGQTSTSLHLIACFHI